MPISNRTYEQIRKLRSMVIEEMQVEHPGLTVEHLKLAEMRVQTIIMADLDDKAVEKERKNFKKNNENN